MVKPYTRAGDKGETSVIGGVRVSKDSPRLEAYGTVDELNAAIGVARAFIKDKDIDMVLREVQEDLFVVGADLAAPAHLGASFRGEAIPRATEAMTKRLEQIIDGHAPGLRPLRAFIVPEGGCAGTLLHLSRAVARRAERRVVALSRREEVNIHIITYLNRLSSLLFVLARLCNKRERIQERRWVRRLR